MRSLSLPLAIALALVATACGACSKSSKAGNGPGGSGSHGSPKGGGPVPVTVFPPGIKLEVVDGDGFVVTYASPTATVGSEVRAIVEVKPKKPFHLNHEYPTELTLVAPTGVTVSKLLYENNPDKSEAKVWRDEVGVFEVAYTAVDKSDTPRAIEASFVFAVCTDASCDPKTATLAIPVVTP
jgi:hypothetical protein